MGGTNAAIRTSKRALSSTKPRTKQDIDRDVDAAMSALKHSASKRIRDDMEPRYGIRTSKAFGVPMAQIKQIAKRLAGGGRDHELAQALWDTGWYEARTMAAFVDDPARVTTAQMDRWCRDFDNWAICDTVCFHLFDRTPHAPGRVRAWSRSRDEFVKRAAFALLASLALHDKQAGDQVFIDALRLIERAATDDRNFVKKSVSWALRSIGRRNRTLHAAAYEVAQQLIDTDDSTARWIGKDALRDLSSPKVRAKLAQ